MHAESGNVLATGTSGFIARTLVWWLVVQGHETAR
jgi:hypothetical protein